jgi:mercuric ion transport protein
MPSLETSEDRRVAAPPVSQREELGRQRALAVGGMVGALAASTCCIVPLVLFSLGVSGAWIGTLTALAPYQPLFVAATVAILGYGFYRVYGRPSDACADDSACARPLPNRFVKLGLWTAAVLVTAAFAFNYIAPLMLGA